MSLHMDVLNAYRIQKRLTGHQVLEVETVMSSHGGDGKQTCNYSFFVCLLASLVFLGTCPRTHFVNQAGLELTEFRLPLPPK